MQPPMFKVNYSAQTFSLLNFILDTLARWFSLGTKFYSSGTHLCLSQNDKENRNSSNQKLVHEIDFDKGNRSW